MGSIRNRTWKYFAIYIVIILFAIWLLQNVFLTAFYKNMKIAELQETGSLITQEFLEGDSIDSIIRRKAQEGSTRIQIVDGDGNVVYPRDWMGIFYSTSYNREVFSKILANVEKREGAYNLYDLQTISEDFHSFLYTSYLGNENGIDLYLLMVSVVEPIDSTVQIMKQQFPYIVVVVFIIGLIVSYFISKRLSAPVLDLNDTATELAMGNYDINFPRSDIYELDELSKTLNYAKEELSKMDEMRVSIVANVSHDLKTPLTVIKSYSEMIKDISGEDKEMRDTHLDVIISEADRLTEMVNSILDISKVEMEIDKLEKEELSLRDLTKKIIEKVDVLAKTHDYKFIITGNSDGIIFADTSLMYQVIYNFMSNAVSFVGKDKEVIFDITEKDGEVTYSVIDHGRGIPEAEQEKIWERYYTDHHNHVRNIVGTGLGLHIVQVILKRHGFRYGVESEIGKGSRFYFVAPIYEEE